MKKIKIISGVIGVLAFASWNFSCSDGDDKVVSLLIPNYQELTFTADDTSEKLLTLKAENVDNWTMTPSQGETEDWFKVIETDEGYLVSVISENTGSTRTGTITFNSNQLPKEVVVTVRQYEQEEIETFYFASCEGECNESGYFTLYFYNGPSYGEATELLIIEGYTEPQPVSDFRIVPGVYTVKTDGWIGAGNIIHGANAIHPYGIGSMHVTLYGQFYSTETVFCLVHGSMTVSAGSSGWHVINADFTGQWEDFRGGEGYKVKRRKYEFNDAIEFEEVIW